MGKVVNRALPRKVEGLKAGGYHQNDVRSLGYSVRERVGQRYQKMPAQLDVQLGPIAIKHPDSRGRSLGRHPGNTSDEGKCL